MMQKMLFALVLSSSISITAQSAGDTLTSAFQFQSLDEIVIQENRLSTPFSEQNRNLVVIDQAVIRSLPVQSLNELVSHVSGIDVRQRGPWGVQADVSIDGGTFDQTLILVNGIKVSDPQTGHHLMNLPIALNAIERVEILKGASARIYGINALNGAINIVTRQPKKDLVEAHLFAGTNFEGTDSTSLYAGFAAEAAASINRNNAQHFLSLGHTQSTGYRYNTAFRNQKAFYQNKLRLPKERSLSLLAGFTNNDFGANGFYAPPNDAEAKENVQTALAAIQADLGIASFWILKPRLSYRYNHDDYIFIRQNPSVYRNQHHTHVLDLELNNQFVTDIGLFGLGFELRDEQIRSNSLGKHRRDFLSFFGEYRFIQVRNLLVNLGATAHYNQDFGWMFLPGIDLGYSVSRRVRLFANAGTGQRLPTYTDLYYHGPANVGNPNLRPEHSIHAEAGLKYRAEAWNASASTFSRKTTDFIDWVKDEPSEPWMPLNFQQIQTFGVSLSSDYRYQVPETGVSLLGGLYYTWLQPTITTSENLQKISQYALENLRHQATARLQVGYRNRLHATIAARNQQRVRSESYVLLDSKLSWRGNAFEYYLDISNLTNTQYSEIAAIPLVGRWLTAGVKWSWLK